MRDDVRVGVALEDPHPATGADHTHQLRDGAPTIRDVGQGGDGQGRVELGIIERQGQGVALAQLDRLAESGLVGELAGDGQECRAGIQPEGQAVRRDATRQVPQDDAAAATDLEDPLARPDPEQGEVGVPSRDLVRAATAMLEPRGHFAGFRHVDGRRLAPLIEAPVLLSHDLLRAARAERRLSGQDRGSYHLGHLSLSPPRRSDRRPPGHDSCADRTLSRLLAPIRGQDSQQLPTFLSKRVRNGRL